MKRTLFLVPLLGVLLLTSGCVSTIHFNVNHAKLKKPSVTREGTVSVKPFTDVRPGLTNAMQIGGKGSKAKPVYMAGQKRPVADILTDGFREALVLAGYKAQPAPGAAAPVLEGEISEFWLTDKWKAVCKIGVLLRLRPSEGGQVLWEKRLQSEEDDLMIIPSAMTAAVTTLLNKAVEEFISQAFADAVAGRK
jgi:hypothetical protein